MRHKPKIDEKNILSLVVLFAFTGVFSQGIEFERGSLEETLVKVKKESKIVFMDCYTTWCVLVNVWLRMFSLKRKLENFSIRIL
ncbi:hypothetical protein L3073_16905 [Ancylomarina sp. DW003]|nr:hypothetical protein [Ancylomarina sp. DW003]MDE5423895.1 hypothetical protein [Ancylomarina sp. DW003]